MIVLAAPQNPVIERARVFPMSAGLNVVQPRQLEINRSHCDMLDPPRALHGYSET